MTIDLRNMDIDEVLKLSPRELADVTPVLPVRFNFRYHAKPYFAVVEEMPEGGHRLRLVAEIRRIPYSSENPVRRGHVLMLADRRLRLSHGRYLVNDHQRLCFVSEIAMQTPINGASIVAAVTKLLLKARCYVALAENPDMVMDWLADPAEKRAATGARMPVRARYPAAGRLT